MFSKARRARISVALVALAAVGCTGQVQGDQGKQPGVTTASATSTAARPARPQEIKVDGIDPCKALTPDQMTQLKVARTRRNDNSFAGLENVPMCSYGTTSAPRFSYGVGLVNSQGIDYLRSGGSNMDINNAEVSGYAALQTNLTGVSIECAFWIDVADGQMVLVDYKSGSEKETIEEMCQKVKTGAELALQTLKTLR